MSKIVYIVIIIGLFSCKSNTVAQEKKDVKTEKSIEGNSKDKKPQIEIPGFGDPSDNEITNIDLEAYNRQEPGTMTFNAMLVDFYTDKKICGKSFEAAIKVKVGTIMNSGSGIVNPFSKDQEAIIGFMRSHSKNIEDLKKKFEGSSKNLTLIVKENLCPDLGQDTVFEIIRFTIK
ncbi:hypothetical protein M0D21_16885 [Aquimarina sp. D1M17]|uniref:hypothetical protein n=1 Tax=Aquimarina acroporae TaxID=2937283 RepID=UPI0020BE1FBC|nr:hypothetical protein [Aquimarina acroporae]MCK8523258.1 hypothetical protein [Aquimarina acroporae]